MKHFFLHKHLKTAAAFLLCCIGFCQHASAQIKVKGSVLDSSRRFAVEAVSVLTTSGKGAITDKNGHYEINVAAEDSIWFSYLNKPTRKFAVKDIATPFQFDISLQLSIHTLAEVRLKPASYYLDSINNRLEYAKHFNYKKPSLQTTTPQFGVGAGVDLEAIIEMFRFKKIRSNLRFQNRLLIEEQEKYITHRFNKNIVRKITQEQNDSILAKYMATCRPEFAEIIALGEYDFLKFIKESYERFLLGLPPKRYLNQQSFED